MEHVSAAVVDEANKLIEQTILDNATVSAKTLQNTAKQLLEKATPLMLINENNAYYQKRLKTFSSIFNQTDEQKNMENAKNLLAEVQEITDINKKKAEQIEYTNIKLDFQKQLNAFIGQDTKTLYVYSNAKTKEVTLVEIDDKEALSFNEYFSKMRYQNLQYIQNKKQEQANREKTQKEKENEERAKDLKETYFEVLYRARLMQRKTKQLIVFWDFGKKGRQTLRVTSQGDIHETYASFYLNEKFDLFKKSIHLEKNINEYATNKSYGLIAVDNISGVLQGDISKKMQNVEYAIKSRGASVLGDSDILAIATVISKSSEKDITKNKIQQIQKSLQQSKQKVRQKLNEALTDEIYDLIDQVLVSRHKVLTK